MKKFVAILLAVLTVLSATSMMVFAADDATTTTTTATTAAPVEKNYICDFCGEAFATNAALKEHLDARYPVASHVQYCDNADKGCTESFHTKAAYEAHMAICSFNDTRTDAEKIKDAFAAGDYGTALKLIFNIIVNFLKSDDFKKIVDKIGTFVKGINFDKVVATVKDAASKIPFDKIGDLIKK